MDSHVFSAPRELATDVDPRCTCLVSMRSRGDAGSTTAPLALALAAAAAALRRGGGFAAGSAPARRASSPRGIITGVLSLHTCGTTCCIPAAGPSALAQQAGDTPQRVPALPPHALLLPLPDPPLRARGIPEPSRPRCCPRAPADHGPRPAALLRSRATWPCAPRPPPAHRRHPSAASLGGACWREVMITFLFIF